MTDIFYISFQLTEKEKIVIESEEPIEEIRCCFEEPIYIVRGEEKFLFSNYAVKDILESFEFLFTKALSNQLQLHKSIRNNIGYLEAHNKFYKSDYKTLEKMGIVSYDTIWDGNMWVGRGWVGYKHFICAYDVALWIYNDPDGNVIIECTPYLHVNNDNIVEPYKYKQFLKDYKSLFIIKMSPNTALSVLEQISVVLRQIDKNIEDKNQRYQHEKFLSNR